tara:strand:- start:1872 stop:2039 length:168 start_codon:yes stop_codon:yes gene_type:complete
MAKPSIQEIHVTLEKHIAVSDNRFLELLNRVKRVETIMLATAGTMIVMLIGLLLR